MRLGRIPALPKSERLTWRRHWPVMVGFVWQHGLHRKIVGVYGRLGTRGAWWEFR